MTAYIAWYGKKRERLAEVEQAFVSLLETELDAERITKLAESVRVAQIRAIKAKRAMFPPSEKNAAAVAMLDSEIDRWGALATDAIIQGYRDLSHRHRLSSPVRRQAKPARGW